MVRKIRTALVLVVVLALALPLVSNAEVDLGGMSYDELVALQEKINFALWQCDEWQKVIVPHGVYEIGKDIPEGHWSVTSSDDNAFTSVVWCKKLDEYGVEAADGAWIDGEVISGKNFQSTEIYQCDFQLVSGTYFIVEGGSALFTPYTGDKEFSLDLS